MKYAAPLLLSILLLAACSEKPAEKKGVPPVLITTIQAQNLPLEISERTLGSLEAVNDPKISAEFAGRVAKITVRAGELVKKGQLLAQIDPRDAQHQAAADSAEIARLNALLAQQERLVVRQTELVQKGFISRNALEDVSAQRDALKSQLDSAHAKSGLSSNNVSKTRIIAPFDGVVEEQLAAEGDYIKLGDPLFRLISNARLRAHLPFAESAAPRLRVGMPVRIASPLSPEITITGQVEDIRPSVSEGNRTIDVIARFDNPGPLKSGGSVDASVITGQKEQAVLVPEQVVVLRPAGKVVYLINDGKAKQQIIEVGSKQNGMIEVIKGLNGGETLALDGAGFLSENATVHVKEMAKTVAKAESAAK